MAPRWLLCLAVVLAAVWVQPLPAAGQAYTYRDEHGRWHFTDNYAAVPEKYRDQVQERPMETRSGGAEQGEDTSVVTRILEQPLGGSDTSGADAIQEALGTFFAQVDSDRRARGLPPLSRQQKRQFGEWARGAVVPWVLAAVLSLLATVVLVIHGFSNGHPVWAVANLLLYVTQPVYVLLHMARENALVRAALLALVLAPVAISVYLVTGMFELIRTIAA